MLRSLLVGLLAIACTVPCWAEPTSNAAVAPAPAPTVAQWVDMLQQVRQHPLFKELAVKYGRAPVEHVKYSPVGVMPREGLDCVVVIAEGDNPKMQRIMQLNPAPEVTRVLLLTMAAHELGHCFRIRSKHLTTELWDRVRATLDGSPEREALEKTLSIEEAYADAYAFAYLQDAHPQSYGQVLQAMHTLRYDPYFATRFYQVDPLYQQLTAGGLDTKLPLALRVEALMRQARF